MPTAGFLKQLEGFCEAQVISAAKLACHGSSPTYSVSQKRSTNTCKSGSRRLRLRTNNALVMALSIRDSLLGVPSVAEGGNELVHAPRLVWIVLLHTELYEVSEQSRHTRTC